MKLIITDIRTLSKLMDNIGRKSINNTDIKVFAILSALPKAQRAEAKELERMEAITLVELEEKDSETYWLYSHMNKAISLDQLIAIRYAMLNDIVLLTDDKVLTNIAEEYEVKIIGTDSLPFHPSFWNSFKTQLVQFNRVAVLL